MFQGNYDSCISPKRAEGSLGNIRHTGELYIRHFRNEKESSLCSLSQRLLGRFLGTKENWPMAEQRVIRNNLRNLSES